MKLFRSIDGLRGRILGLDESDESENGGGTVANEPRIEQSRWLAHCAVQTANFL